MQTNQITHVAVFPQKKYFEILFLIWSQCDTQCDTVRKRRCLKMNLKGNLLLFSIFVYVDLADDFRCLPCFLSENPGENGSYTGFITLEFERSISFILFTIILPKKFVYGGDSYLLTYSMCCLLGSVFRKWPKN